MNGEQVAIWPRTHQVAGRFEVAVGGLVEEVPDGIRIRDGLLVDVSEVRRHPDNPANRWRDDHPYPDYRRYLELP